MRRFHFALEKLLNLRIGREKEAEMELGRAVGILADIENRLRLLAEERVRAAAGRFAGGNGAAEIRTHELYIIRLDTTKNELLEAAAKAEAAVEEARAAYIEALRERKVMDKLRERGEREYRRAAFAEEIKIIDDSSGGAAARAGVLAG